MFEPFNYAFMSKCKLLLDAKREFLARCHVIISENERENFQTAARKGVQAASQRSHLYSPNATNANKVEIAGYWVERLMAISEDYKNPQTFCKFLEDVLGLEKDMNLRFPDMFANGANGANGYAQKFRLAHAQKSLSVSLKHLWCMDIIPEPPMCPIDRGILGKVGVYECWTKLDDVCVYESWKNAVWKTASERNMSMSEWELTCWNDENVDR